MGRRSFFFLVDPSDLVQQRIPFFEASKVCIFVHIIYILHTLSIIVIYDNSIAL